MQNSEGLGGEGITVVLKVTFSVLSKEHMGWVLLQWTIQSLGHNFISEVRTLISYSSLSHFSHRIHCLPLICKGVERRNGRWVY